MQSILDLQNIGQAVMRGQTSQSDSPQPDQAFLKVFERQNTRVETLARRAKDVNTKSPVSPNSERDPAQKPSGSSRPEKAESTASNRSHSPQHHQSDRDSKAPPDKQRVDSPAETVSESSRPLKEKTSAVANGETDPAADQSTEGIVLVGGQQSGPSPSPTSGIDVLAVNAVSLEGPVEASVEAGVEGRAEEGATLVVNLPLQTDQFDGAALTAPLATGSSAGLLSVEDTVTDASASYLNGAAPLLGKGGPNKFVTIDGAAAPTELGSGSLKSLQSGTSPYPAEQLVVQDSKQSLEGSSPDALLKTPYSGLKLDGISDKPLQAKLAQLEPLAQNASGIVVDDERISSEDKLKSGFSVSTAAALMSKDISGARVQMPVSISFGKPEWAGMVAERSAMMAAQKLSFAELQLDPPELGPLQVRVQVQNDQVSVSFVSGNAGVREALDQTATRLRELCDQQGLNLVDVDVSDHSQQQAESDAERGSESGGTPSMEEAEQVDNPLDIIAQGGIDYYA